MLKAGLEAVIASSPENNEAPLKAEGHDVGILVASWLVLHIAKQKNWSAPTVMWLQIIVSPEKLLSRRHIHSSLSKGILNWIPTTWQHHDTRDPIHNSLLNQDIGVNKPPYTEMFWFSVQKRWWSTAWVPCVHLVRCCRCIFWNNKKNLFFPQVLFFSPELERRGLYMQCF